MPDQKAVSLTLVIMDTQINVLFMSPLRRHKKNIDKKSICHEANEYMYIRLLHGKIGFLVFFGPSSVNRGRTHIVLG